LAEAAITVPVKFDEPAFRDGGVFKAGVGRGEVEFQTGEMAPLKD
jgi:hypothetical protein